MLIDSHCHLSSDELFIRLPEVMQRAKEAGVDYVLNAGSRFEQLPEQLKICADYPNTWTLTGVHPHDAVNYTHITASDVIKNTQHAKVIGIGECGLDYFYDFSPKDVQIKVFREMISAAQETELPLVIHTRDADDDTIALLSQAHKIKPLTGVIHCYSSSWELAKAALDLGFYISASGIITFKNSVELRSFFANIPPERLLVETDSPYLAPVPLRGKTNEPSYVLHTAQCLAEIKGLDFATISAITSKNFFNLFQKAQQTIK